VALDGPFTVHANGGVVEARRADTVAVPPGAEAVAVAERPARFIVYALAAAD
jgi:hypothetical protein